MPGVRSFCFSVRPVLECSLWALHARTMYDSQSIVESPFGAAMTLENYRFSSENKKRKTLPKCCTCHEIHTRKTDRETQITMAQLQEERVGVLCLVVVQHGRAKVFKNAPDTSAFLCGGPLGQTFFKRSPFIPPSL